MGTIGAAVVCLVYTLMFPFKRIGLFVYRPT